MKDSIAEKTAYFGMFVALAFIFSYVESLIPFSIGIPGVKLGLANVVVLTAIYALGTKEGFFISIARVVLAGFTFSNAFTMVYSLGGGILSWAAMSIFKESKKFSMIGVSIIGGVFHNIGQIIVAGILIKTRSLIYYLPVLMIVGALTGIVTGYLAKVLLKIYKRI